jgi:hypothetical protein
MTRAEELTPQGWRRQATYDEPRLSEMAGAYREIGLQVHTEAFHPEDEKGCTGCLATFPDLYKTIYTHTQKANQPMRLSKARTEG